jgi:hypothetical protein
MNAKTSSSPEPADVRQRLTAVRDALLHLHKALMETERIGYERTFGKIQTPYQFLKLLTEDPWFAWFRPVSQLIAAIDETLDAKELLTDIAANNLMARTKNLLVPTVGGEGFSQHYDEALQRDPDVVFAHAAVAKLLRA